MNCPKCGSSPQKNGTSRHGTKRYKCVPCGLNFSDPLPPKEPVPKQDLYRLPPIAAKYYETVKQLSAEREITIRQLLEQLLDDLIE